MKRAPAPPFIPTPARLALVFGLVLVLKGDALLRPPVWDSAMGLFPPAITLAETGFDLVGLLGMPGYEQGGPNGHSTSPVTLVTALAWRLTGGGAPAFVLLHLLHFAVTAAALLALYRIAEPLFASRGAGLFCLACLLHPVFSAQAGMMYMEMPLFLCAVSAIAAWVDGRTRAAIAWGTLAVAIKETGLIVPASLAVVALLARGPLPARIRTATLVVVGPLAWLVGTRLLRRFAVTRADDFEYVPSLDAVFGGMGQYLDRFLLNVPDLILWLGVFAAAFTLSAPVLWRALRSEPTPPEQRTPEQRVRLILALTGLPIVFFLLLFGVALPVLAGFTIVLPRYFTVVLPFLLLWTGYAVTRLAGGRAERAAVTTWAALAVLFAVNTNGTLYPSDVDTEGPGNDQPLTERSNAYRRLQDLQIQAMGVLEALPPGVPVYYGHYEHYLLEWPQLGYASGPLPDGHDFWIEPLAPLVSAPTFPPCVYALYNYPWLGGRDVLGLVRFAETRPDLVTETVRELRDGPYRIILARIRHVDADCPA